MAPLQCRAVGAGICRGCLKKVCHVTSVHRADDVRITHKECASMAQAGWEVHLVASGILRTGLEGVAHHPLPSPPKSRLWRMLAQPWRVYGKAVSIDADVYHLHDPELLPVGFLLKQRGKSVVYDVHEDVPRDIMTKRWIPQALRPAAAWFADAVERMAASSFNGVVAATPMIAQRFPQEKTATVRNFPLESEFPKQSNTTMRSRGLFVYVGLINDARGLDAMLQAAGLLRSSDATLELAGLGDAADIDEVLSRSIANDNVRYLGLLDREGVSRLLSKAVAGLVVLKPLQSFQEALPVKMFEYMAAGLPVIASDFPLWRTIIDGEKCGILVDPLDPQALASTMSWILEHPAEAAEMGKRGRAAVRERYNWESEARALLGFYDALSPRNSETRPSAA